MKPVSSLSLDRQSAETRLQHSSKRRSTWSGAATGRNMVNTKERRRVVTTALQVSPCLASLGSSLSSSTVDEGARLRRASSFRTGHTALRASLVCSGLSLERCAGEESSILILLKYGQVMSTFVLLGMVTPSSSHSAFSLSEWLRSRP